PIRLDWQVGVGSSGSTPTTLPMECLAVPEDHTAPDAVLEVLFQSHLQACDPNGALGADRLSRRQVGSRLAEEEVVVVAVCATAVSVDVFHLANLSCDAATKKAAGRVSGRRLGEGFGGDRT